MVVLVPFAPLFPGHTLWRHANSNTGTESNLLGGTVDALVEDRVAKVVTASPHTHWQLCAVVVPKHASVGGLHCCLDGACFSLASHC